MIKWKFLETPVRERGDEEGSEVKGGREGECEDDRCRRSRRWRGAYAEFLDYCVEVGSKNNGCETVNGFLGESVPEYLFPCLIVLPRWILPSLLAILSSLSKEYCQ